MAQIHGNTIAIPMAVTAMATIGQPYTKTSSLISFAFEFEVAFESVEVEADAEESKEVMVVEGIVLRVEVIRVDILFAGQTSWARKRQETFFF